MLNILNLIFVTILILSIPGTIFTLGFIINHDLNKAAKKSGNNLTAANLNANIPSHQ